MKARLYNGAACVQRAANHLRSGAGGAQGLVFSGARRSHTAAKESLGAEFAEREPAAKEVNGRTDLRSRPLGPGATAPPENSRELPYISGHGFAAIRGSHPAMLRPSHGWLHCERPNGEGGRRDGRTSARMRWGTCTFRLGSGRSSVPSAWVENRAWPPFLGTIVLDPAIAPAPGGTRDFSWTASLTEKEFERKQKQSKLTADEQTLRGLVAKLHREIGRERTKAVTRRCRTDGCPLVETAGSARVQSRNEIGCRAVGAWPSGWQATVPRESTHDEAASDQDVAMLHKPGRAIAYGEEQELTLATTSSGGRPSLGYFSSQQPR